MSSFYQSLDVGGRKRESDAIALPSVGYYSVVHEDGMYLTLRICKGRGNFFGKTLLAICTGFQYRKIAFISPSGKLNFWHSFLDTTPVALVDAIREAYQRILADPTECGLSYALREGKCFHCNRTLITPASLAAGLGPCCSGVRRWKKKDHALAFDMEAAERKPVRVLTERVQ